MSTFSARAATIFDLVIGFAIDSILQWDRVEAPRSGHRPKRSAILHADSQRAVNTNSARRTRAERRDWSGRNVIGARRAPRGSGTRSRRGAPGPAPRGRGARSRAGRSAGRRSRRRGARSRRAAPRSPARATRRAARCATSWRMPRSPKSEPTTRATRAMMEARVAAFRRRPTSLRPRSSRVVHHLILYFN